MIMRQPLLKQQPILRLSGTQGTERTHTVPSTLTKIILVLLTMLLLPSAAWGQTVTVTKTITFNKEVDAVTSDINESMMSVSVTEQITGGSSTSYDGQVKIWDYYNRLSQYSCSTNGGAVFTYNNENTNEHESFTIEIPGVYPNVPTQVTLTVAYSNSDATNTGENKIQVGDYGNEIQATSPPETGADAATYYRYYHPYRSNETSLNETPLTYTGNNTSGLGTNRDEQKSQCIYVYLSKGATFTIKEATITYETNNYGLTVAGIPVTGVNAANILGDQSSSVSFEGTTPATLTLNGAEINYESGNVIVSTLTTPLEVVLSGNSNINSGSNLPFEGATGDNANLVFKCEDSGSLLMSSTHAGFSTTSFYTGFNKVLYPEDEGNLYAYLSEDNVVIEPITSYGLTVAGVEVTSANCDDILKDDSYNAGKVSFTPAIIGQTSSTPATLTLKGVTIEGRITWSNPEEGELSIIIDGDNAITNSGGALISFEGGSQTPPQLSFSKAEGSGAKTLVLQSDEFPISGFDISSSSTIGDGLKAVSGQKYMGITTKDVYDLWIDGTQVHDIPELPGYKDNILKKTTATVSFDGSQTLTLNNAEISSTSSTNAIETGLSTLNIDLKGNNSITTEGGYALYGQGTNLIIFTSSSDPVGNLTLKNYSGELAKLVTIQYDTNTGLVPTIITPSDASDLAAAREAIIAKGTALGITVAGVVVTNSNYTDIKGDGITGTKVSFTPADEGNETPAILTLNNASITGDVKFNDDLTVHLVGDNTITKPEDASSSSYAFDLSNIYNTLDFSTDETEPGTLKIVGSYSGLQDDGIIYNGKIKGGSATIGTTGDAVIWKQTFSTTGVTPSYFILSLNKHYNLWKNGHQYHDLILDNNDGYVFNPEESTLTISSSSSSDYINSGLENLTIIVNGTQSMSYIAFGAPEDTQAEGITTGTLTITGKEDSESSSNSLSLSNSDGGVITGFSSVSLTLPMHVSSPENFTGWTASVTSATITDETYNLSWKFEHGESYATYCDPSMDLYLPSTITPSVITEISGSTVKTQALSYIPKGVPVLLSKTNNTATTATFSKNLLKYVESSENPVTASESKVLYVLYNDQFVKVTPGSEIYYGGYLDLTGVSLPANTRGLSIDGIDGTSAIDATIFEELNTEGDAWYDLQGRKLQSKPTKAGLYIFNGKKIVLK